jgi:hypothetical protein
MFPVMDVFKGLIIRNFSLNIKIPILSASCNKRIKSRCCPVNIEIFLSDGRNKI